MSTIPNNAAHLLSQQKNQVVKDTPKISLARIENLPTTTAASVEVMRRAAWRDVNPGPRKTISQIFSKLQMIINH
jgi:hypothetical protein